MSPLEESFTSRGAVDGDVRCWWNKRTNSASRRLSTKLKVSRVSLLSAWKRTIRGHSEIDAKGHNRSFEMLIGPFLTTY